MIKLPKQQTQSLLAVHGWSGVLLGLLLYAVICTGVAAVFAKEISDWSSPLSRPSGQELPTGFDAAYRDLARQVDPLFLHEVFLFPTAGGRWNVLFHVDEKDAKGQPVERGTEFELDPKTLKPLARRDGLLDEIADQRRSNAVADFLVDLHVRLHLPNPWGLLLTGTLGLMMMVAAVSGLFLHRHLFKEIFTLRRRGGLLTARDVHVVAGAWNLPFAFLLAFTGSFFSFATTIGVPAMAMVAFNGDIEAATAALTAKKLPEDPSPVTPANLDALFADARQRGGARVGFVSLEHWGRADARATVQLEAREGGLLNTAYLYSLASGEFIREQPFLGHVPSTGNSLVLLMSPLHFGNFAGVVSKSVWFALGFAGAYVTLTGMLLWTRRRQEQRSWRIMDRAVHLVGYGLPLALAVAPYAYFLLRDRGPHPADTQGVLFLAVAATLIVCAAVADDLTRYRRRLLAATGVALAGLPLARLASGGIGWSAAWQQGLASLLAVELALFVAGALYLRLALRRSATDEATPAAGPAMQA
ncbi:MAG: PepSY-associated TM helix domain-containing protein [Stagnimonas sp.]|nr:PepSY-associated TM helix domain-containing protein [Stagnimonas sp.]